MVMVFGGNNRAREFFKQHGWTDSFNMLEAKYTSRAANLYRQVLANDVAKAMAEETTTALPSSPLVTSEPLKVRVSRCVFFTKLEDRSSFLTIVFF